MIFFLPPIILNKIDWYRWRYLQNQLCIEYHKLFKLNSNSIYTPMCYMIGTRCYSCFNDRKLEDPICGGGVYENIYNFLNGFQIAIIPNRYYYSDGSKHNKYK